jgi:type VI secretion system secreted protein VgrG
MMSASGVLPALASSLASSASGLLGGALQSLSSRLDFFKLLDQHGRMLQVETALPSLSLVPERVVMREAVSQPFELEIDALSTSVHFELKRFIGEQISVRLLQADGSYKPWHGYVFDASQLGGDGGLARYRLRMRPWISFMGLRRDCFVYQDKDARQIIDDLVRDHEQANLRWDVSEPLRMRSLCVQYRETDLEFVQRLLAEEGLSYRFEHLDGEAASNADGKRQARHVMVITDRLAERPSLGQARFTSQHASATVLGQRDAVTAFSTMRDVTANAVTIGAWDYRQLAGTTAQDASTLALGELPTLEIYDGAGAYRYENAAHAGRAASLALAALELDIKRFEGQGSGRHFEAGLRFQLVDHPLYGANTTAFNYAGALTASHSRPDNEFTLLAVEHHARNNLGSEAAKVLALSEQELTELEHGTYKNHFFAAPAAAAVVPRFIRKPSAHGVQTALVVGVNGETLTTDRDHRVKVQFPWQRGEAPLPGGLSHESPVDAAGNATNNERSGTWVRVALPSAGANWGAVLTPRVGTEVVVEFIEGDIDRPLIVGQLYNGQDLPPFSAGEDSGVNHPGVLSGMHTQGLDGSGFNQWAVDDATGQLRMRLLSSYTAAEVGLGHLIQQGTGAQRGAWRGSGFEANATAWATVRAAKGLLVSSTARAGTYGSAQSTQMDAAEAIAQLQAMRDLGQRLSAAAKASQAASLSTHDAGRSVEKFIDSVDPAKQGKHDGNVNGQAAKKAQGRTLTDPVEAFAAPVVVLDTPSSALFTSEASIVSFSGQDLSVAVQGDVQHTAVHTYASVSGQTTSLYTNDGGVQVKAANGPVSLRAHTDELQILADKDVTVISVNDEIRIQANSRIELVAGQSSVVLDGGNIDFTCPGKFEAKTSTHAFLGGGSAPASPPALPAGIVKPQPPENSLFVKFDEQVVFKDNLGQAVEGRLRYRIANKADPAQKIAGNSPTEGETPRIDTPSAQPLEHALRYARFSFDT